MAVAVDSHHASLVLSYTIELCTWVCKHKISTYSIVNTDIILLYMADVNKTKGGVETHTADVYLLKLMMRSDYFSARLASSSYLAIAVASAFSKSSSALSGNERVSEL